MQQRVLVRALQQERVLVLVLVQEFQQACRKQQGQQQRSQR
ncbi:MAG: hypothetical protein ACOYNF_02670 [Rhodoferax sp.]